MYLHLSETVNIKQKYCKYHDKTTASKLKSGRLFFIVQCIKPASAIGYIDGKGNGYCSRVASDVFYCGATNTKINWRETHYNALMSGCLNMVSLELGGLSKSEEGISSLLDRMGKAFQDIDNTLLGNLFWGPTSFVISVSIEKKIDEAFTTTTTKYKGGGSWSLMCM